MDEHENLYEKIQEMLGSNPGTLNILEQQIDVDLQVEYFECSRKLRLELNEDWALENMPNLKEPGTSLELKKDLLARLATIERVECFRAIESYLKTADRGLKDWAFLSLMESRMQLESTFLEENQIFISTGLGGRADKLRYFLVLTARERLNFDRNQQKVIQNEFEFVLKRYQAEIEQASFSEYVATLIILLPLQHPLKQVIEEAINESNNYGNFINDQFVVTNVKTLSFEEIKDHLVRKSAE